MPPEVRERAVEPFFTTKEVGSSGLGLSQVYGVAKQLGGAIRIDSAPGTGTIVHVYLRRAAAESPAATNRDRAAAGVVLLVDDEPDVRRTTARLLHELGYPLRRRRGCAAGAGAAARGAAHRAAPH
jgi:hypothetical protein